MNFVTISDIEADGGFLKEDFVVWICFSSGWRRRAFEKTKIPLRLGGVARCMRGGGFILPEIMDFGLFTIKI